MPLKSGEKYEIQERKTKTKCKTEFIIIIFNMLMRGGIAVTGSASNSILVFVALLLRYFCQGSSKGRQFPRRWGVAFRGVFAGDLGKVGELLKSNSYSVEQAVSYFRRSFIYGRLNVF